MICNTGGRIAGNETTKASYKKNRVEAIARVAADQCYRNAAALRAWSVRLVRTPDPGFVKGANRPGNKGWQTGQPEGPTDGGWIGLAVGRREKWKCVGRRHASTTGGSDRSQVTLGWKIRAVEGEYNHVPSKMLYTQDFQLNPWGTSAAFGSRLGMTPIENVKKQVIKRKEFSQFVLAFMAFGSPVAPDGTRRC